MAEHVNNSSLHMEEVKKEPFCSSYSIFHKITEGYIVS